MSSYNPEEYVLIWALSPQEDKPVCLVKPKQKAYGSPYLIWNKI